jgi:acetyltransferase
MLLMDKMIRYLRSQGTQRLVGLVLRENEAMRELARQLGFEADAHASGDALRLVMNLAPAATSGSAR